jgi:hypothetical protein
MNQIIGDVYSDTASSGYIYLVLDITIENKGYDYFNTNRFGFFVIANNIKYEPAFVFSLDNELNTLDVLNGGKLRGKIAFEIPEETSAYTLGHNNYGDYNITFINTGGSNTINPPAQTPTLDKKIIISYSSDTMMEIGSGYFSDKPRSGYIYLVLDIMITNQGYDSFSVSPYNFAVVINSVKYETAIVTELDNQLISAEVLDGGTINGKLAFEIPLGISTSNLEVVYDSYESYDIIWTER